MFNGEIREFSEALPVVSEPEEVHVVGEIVFGHHHGVGDVRGGGRKSRDAEWVRMECGADGMVQSFAIAHSGPPSPVEHAAPGCGC